MLAALIALPFAAQLIAFTGVDQSRFARPAEQQQTREMRFREMDRNYDGVITRAEWRGSEQSFRAHDWNGDGILSGDEVRPGALRPFDTAQQDEGIREDREDTFDNLDVNRNNQIERHEWHASTDAFEWLDRNRDGVLSRREVVGGRRNAQTGAVGTSGRQDCVEDPQRIVDLLYQQVLERQADQASSGTAQALASGRMTVRDIVAQLAKSDEHASRYFWQPVVKTVYQQMLKREPNEQELREASSQLASGQKQLADIVGRSALRATNNEEEAVKMLYRRLLGRDADQAGLRDFTDLARRQGIEAAAREIVNSREYRQRAGSSNLAQEDAAAYDAAVRSLYRHVLGRDPDPAGLRDLTRVAMNSGFDAAVDQMVRSAEYERLYGNDTVPGRNVRYCGTTLR